ncbi:MAG: response regulator [Oscillospiraceae bacterium]|nr:response regulator [Oscillospiraceae bacterium]
MSESAENAAGKAEPPVPSADALSAYIHLSSEIRTPISAIIGMAELALREEDPAGAQEHLLTIKQAGRNLLSVVNDVLDFAAIGMGQFEAARQDYRLSALIYDVIDIMKPAILESRLRFIVDIDCDIPDRLRGDAARVRQMMINLLKDAVKATEKGYLSLSVQGEAADADTLQLVIRVSDSRNGVVPGEIPAGTDSAVFEGTGLELAISGSLAKALNGTLTVASGGGRGGVCTAVIPQQYRSGLKLAAVEDPGSKRVLVYERRHLCIRSIRLTMESLGVPYTIVSSAPELYDELTKTRYSVVFIASVLYEQVKEIYSEFESRAEFVLIAEFGEAIADRNVSIITTPVFCLPVANLLNGVSDRFVSNLSKSVAARRIAPDAVVLVVDDIKTNLKIAEGLLQPYKLRADMCKSGEEALRAVKAVRYDLIFMDHMMPGMDGAETLARIRALGSTDPYCKTVPVIALTAGLAADTKEMLLSKGFDDFLSKPIDILKLNATLEKWLPKDKQKTPRDGAETRKEPSAREDAGDSIQIEGVNAERGILLNGGTVDNYIMALSAFRKDGVKMLNEIKSSLARQDTALYTVHVYGLKSAAATIGADKLSEDARLLGAAGRREDLNYIRGHNDALLADLKILIERICGVVSRDGLTAD